jgi:REP element-mobilizing transposase RayT
MRANRVLVPKGWFWVSTDVNNREAVFRLSWVVQLLHIVLCEARKFYEFEIRGLRIEADRVSFYINAVDGFQLPDIMQWWKQTFSVRFNLECGRSGHIWGERYWSVVLGREPPETAEVYDFAVTGCDTDGAEAAGGGETNGKNASGRVRHEGAERAEITRLPLRPPRCAAQSTV